VLLVLNDDGSEMKAMENPEVPAILYFDTGLSIGPHNGRWSSFSADGGPQHADADPPG
jgi:hypothetical protein